MSWRMSVGVPVLMSLAGIAGAPGLVRADDAYLCGPDKVVYVNTADLEAKKHSDPCIAAYYGITLDEPVKAQSKTLEAKPKAAASKSAFEKITLKTSDVSEVPGRVRRHLQRDAMLLAPKAAAGTDFRNVRVINAVTGEEQWFRHTR